MNSLTHINPNDKCKCLVHHGQINTERMKFALNDYGAAHFKIRASMRVPILCLVQCVKMLVEQNIWNKTPVITRLFPTDSLTAFFIH